MCQTDSARCFAWVRYSLNEGSIGSYLTLLSEDIVLLK